MLGVASLLSSGGRADAAVSCSGSICSASVGDYAPLCPLADPVVCLESINQATLDIEAAMQSQANSQQTLAGLGNSYVINFPPGNFDFSDELLLGGAPVSGAIVIQEVNPDPALDNQTCLSGGPCLIVQGSGVDSTGTTLTSSSNFAGIWARVVSHMMVRNLTMKQANETGLQGSYVAQGVYGTAIGGQLFPTLTVDIASTESASLSDVGSSISVQNPGVGYQVGDSLVFGGGAFSSAASVVVTSVSRGHGVTSVTPLATGSYTAFPPSPVVAAGGQGSGVTFNVMRRIVKGTHFVSIGGAGSNYCINDVLTVVGGVFAVPGVASPTVLTVNGIHGNIACGGISSVAVVQYGDYGTFPSGKIAVTGGMGHHATFNVAYTPSPLAIYNAARNLGQNVAYMTAFSNPLQLPPDHVQSTATMVNSGVAFGFPQVNSRTAAAIPPTQPDPVNNPQRWTFTLSGRITQQPVPAVFSMTNTDGSYANQVCMHVDSGQAFFINDLGLDHQNNGSDIVMSNMTWSMAARGTFRGITGAQVIDSAIVRWPTLSGQIRCHSSDAGGMQFGQPADPPIWGNHVSGFTANATADDTIAMFNDVGGQNVGGVAYPQTVIENSQIANAYRAINLYMDKSQRRAGFGKSKVVVDATTQASILPSCDVLMLGAGNCPVTFTK